ncbi:Aquaporin-9 [Zancudomyces culisetae]|uniref:Aquaporin-9 n=1 Tax=Zancudomyces culisetae TaxID=1213189 RepID=A0A1R1PHP1_ZANCU|nr:Aquaporin-9 [Zancudomyces culisetae]|eukprot:OMH80433.1 Aquaporin-9 [Zancudomyces culisetae]
MSDAGLEKNGSASHEPLGNGNKPPRAFPLYGLRYAMREYLAEFFGTALLIFFGNTVVATVTFNETFAPAKWVIITFGWGFGLAMALYISMGVSGGHLNPAVTIANAVYGHFSWIKVPGFIFCQVLGAFFGAALTYGVFRPQFHTFAPDGKLHVGGDYGTGGIFCTYPNPKNSTWDNFYTECLLTGILMFVIRSMFEPKLTPVNGYAPIAVGLLVFTIGLCVGTTTGYAINPARDFGPRVFTAIAGWGSEPFTASNHYFWNPIVAPIVGAIVGFGLYELVIIPNED